jgi:hypothetical protein
MYTISYYKMGVILYDNITWDQLSMCDVLLLHIVVKINFVRALVGTPNLAIHDSHWFRCLITFRYGPVNINTDSCENGGVLGHCDHPYKH